jgi:transposase
MPRGVFGTGPFRDAIATRVDADVRRTMLAVSRQVGGDTAAMAEILGVDKGTVVRWVRRLDLAMELVRHRKARRLIAAQNERAT